MDTDRYKKTLEVSGQIWKVYKNRLENMRPDEEWWDETVKMFNSFANTYKGTTHEKYINHYVMACLDDLGEVTQCSS